MNKNVYQLWDAIGGVDEKLIYEIQEYHTIQQKKRRNLISGLSAVACIMLFVLSFPIINSMTAGNKNPNGSNTDWTYSASSETEKVKINEWNSGFNAKYGGTIQQVSRELWSEKFDTDIFKCNSNTKYFLSYSKEKNVLYGVLEIKTKSNELISVRVGKNTMIDSEYNQLSKTNINGVDMAICSIEDGAEDSKTQYCAVYSKSHIVYTIEWGEGDLSEFIAALKEVVQFQ